MRYLKVPHICCDFSTAEMQTANICKKNTPPSLLRYSLPFFFFFAALPEQLLNKESKSHGDTPQFRTLPTSLHRTFATGTEEVTMRA